MSDEAGAGSPALIIIDHGYASNTYRYHAAHPDRIQGVISVDELRRLKRFLASDTYADLIKGEVVSEKWHEDLYGFARERAERYGEWIEEYMGIPVAHLSDEITMRPDYSPRFRDGELQLKLKLYLFCGESCMGPVEHVGMHGTILSVKSGPVMVNIRIPFDDGEEDGEDGHDDDTQG